MNALLKGYRQSRVFGPQSHRLVVRRLNRKHQLVYRVTGKGEAQSLGAARAVIMVVRRC